MRYLIVAFLLLAADATAQTSTAILISPDGRLVMSFQTISKNEPVSTGGQLAYAVTFEGKQLISRSNLRLTLGDKKPLGAEVRIVNSTVTTTDVSYQLVTGKASSVRDYYNALQLDLDEDADPKRKLQIEARAYNDAVAFRYVVPAQTNLADFRLSNEATEFRIIKDATAYALVLPHFRSMYESEFIKLPVSALANQGGVKSMPLIGLPLLLDVPGVAWMAIMEADLRDYTAMYLVNPSGGWSGHSFESKLAPQPGDTNLCVTGTLPHHSPWRVLMVAAEPGRLIESTVLTSLNPESAVPDTSWIQPGKAAWNWWSGSIGPDGHDSFTTDTMKYYVDFAARSKLEYMLVDAGWSAGRDILRMNGRVNIPELVNYAAAQGVRIWIWISYDGARSQMEQAFPLYEKWGVAGVKIDFIERDDQEGIAFYYRAAEAAAQHHLMLDFHGCTKPTGMERTYPNIVGYEAVLGMEQSKGGARDNPDNRLMLPFTRMLAGPMDYTPGGFDNVTRNDFVARGTLPQVMGTRAQQLAMYVVYQAAFQMVADHPGAYEDQPAFEFIRHVPATWDETRASGQPGEEITIARRHGNEWYLGSMTNWKARQLDIPLTFLGPGRYVAEIYADAKDADQFPKGVVIEKKRVVRSTHLKAQLAPGGGYAVRLVPLSP